MLIMKTSVKNIILVVAAMMSASVAFADGYVGVVRSKGNLAYKCNTGLECNKSTDLLRAYAGTRLDTRDQIDLMGAAKIDAIEVGYWRGAKPSAHGVAQATYFEPNAGIIYLSGDPGNTNPYLPVKYTIGFDAITLAASASAQLTDDFSFVGKAGVAYMVATKRYEFDGRSNQSWTAGKFKPYLGLGLNYKLLDGLVLTGAVDMSQYEVDGTKGSIKAIGVGAEYAY
jgi:hypothetical protein